MWLPALLLTRHRCAGHALKTQRGIPNVPKAVEQHAQAMPTSRCSAPAVNALPGVFQLGSVFWSTAMIEQCP